MALAIDLAIRRAVPEGASPAEGTGGVLLGDAGGVGPEMALKLLARDANRQAAERLLALPHPPTALFGAQNLVTIGALRALRDAGRQFEVALVGFDDFELADLLQPAVTVVAQDPQEIGHLAAERLFARLDGDDSPFHTHVVTTQLIVRGSGEIPPR